MNSYKVIDMEGWPRRKLFEYYRKFDSPAFNVSVSLDAGNLYALSKKRGESFFLTAFYAILRAANEVPQMRQRVIGGQVVEFDRIAGMTPILTTQELFHQIWCEYEPDYVSFKTVSSPKVESAKNDEPSPMEGHGEDFICASCVPWLHFTSITQANYHFDQTIPILAWGRMDANRQVPISCKFNHCLMDGIHVGRFFQKIEKSFSDPESLFREVVI